MGWQYKWSLKLVQAPSYNVVEHDIIQGMGCKVRPKPRWDLRCSKRLSMSPNLIQNWSRRPEFPCRFWNSGLILTQSQTRSSPNFTFAETQLRVISWMNLDQLGLISKLWNYGQWIERAACLVPWLYCDIWQSNPWEKEFHFPYSCGKPMFDGCKSLSFLAIWDRHSQGFSRVWKSSYEKGRL